MRASEVRAGDMVALEPVLKSSSEVTVEICGLPPIRKRTRMDGARSGTTEVVLFQSGDGIRCPQLVPEMVFIGGRA